MPPTTTTATSPDTRAVPILARSLYRELRASGFGEREVLAFATELLGMVASEHETRDDDGR